MARFLALVAIVFWGISFVATKTVLRELSPVTLIFVRFSVGALMLLAFARRLPPRDSWRQLALMGFIGIFVHQMLQAYGLTMTTAMNGGWLVGITPIWSAILASLVTRERFGAWKIAALAGGFAGALLVVTRGELSARVVALPSTRGDLLIFLSTWNWALYSVVGHATLRRLGPRLATAGAMTCGAIMLAPFFVAARGWRELPSLSTAGWLSVAFLSIGCSGLGYLFWYGALEKIEVSRVAALLYLEPLVTFAAAVVLIGEPVRPVVVAGGLVVLASVLVSQYAPAVPSERLSPEKV